MKKIFLSIIVTTVLFAIGCQTKTEIKKDEHAGHSNQNSATKQPAEVTAELKTAPAEIKAGEPTELSFTIKNPNGEVAKDLQIVHEKPLHLLIVSEDLAEFYHEHPTQQADGSFKVPFTFKNGGKFKLYADFTPKDGRQTVKNFSVNVGGNERPREELKADEKFEKTVDDLLVTMKADGEISSGKDLMLSFQVADAKTKKPVTDLENYLGEKAHFVVISKDLIDFVHAHPKSGDNVKHSHDDKSNHTDKLAGKDAESIISAHLAFPQSGLYKIFAQFKRGGKITTVPFVVNVKGAEKADAVKPVEVPKDAYKVTVSKDGFTPSEVSFAKGKFTKLAFHRTDAENCGSEVVFKSLNITKKLPVGEVVIVDLPKDFAGNLEFACGMNMYRGKIVVE